MTNALKYERQKDGEILGLERLGIGYNNFIMVMCNNTPVKGPGSKSQVEITQNTCVMAITGLLCEDVNLDRLFSHLSLVEELYLGMVTYSPVLPILSHPQHTEKTNDKESQISLHCR